MGQINDFLKRNIKNLIILALLVFSIHSYIFNAKYKIEISQEVEHKKDSLNAVLKTLEKEQEKYDSLLTYENNKIKSLNGKIKNLKSEIDNIQDYYEGLQGEVHQYTPTQVDSFFRQRYKY